MRLNPPLRRWLPWLLLAIAVAITAAVYWPGVTGGWVFDDYPNIVDNAAIHIQPGHATLAAWVNAALSSPASFLHRPLASITFALNWMAGGGSPWPFKVTNIVIHLVNGVLVYCMLRALLRLVGVAPSPAERPTSRIDDATAARLALLVAAAWMLSPINLMAVLYVVQRMESLCQVFVLAGLWAYLHGRWMMLTANGNRGRDRRGLALAVVGIVFGTLLGLTSKETAVLLPVFAFLAEVVVMRFRRVTRARSEAETGRADTVRQPDLETAGSARPAEGAVRQDPRLWAMFTITLFIPAVLGFLWLLRTALNPAAWSGRSFTLAQRLMTEPRVGVDYLKWTLFPDPDVLSLYHDEIVKSTGFLTPESTLGAMLLLAALIVVAVLLRHRRPLVALGIGWFFAGNLLTATIIPLELVYEQRMYFASIGVLLAAGALVVGVRWKTVLPWARALVVVVALGWFGTALWMRAEEWSSQLGLAVAEANRHPESARAVYEAGRLLLIASHYEPGKQLDESRKYLHAAATLPGSSALADQALIMIADHDRQGADADDWHNMIRKLRTQPTRQEDISALISLTNCHNADICRFNPAWLNRAYLAALSRPHPIARLYGAYAAFQRDTLHNDALATRYLALAVHGDPGEPAYRIDLAVLYTRAGELDKARAQIDALKRMNLAGRLNGSINNLERLVAQARGAGR